MDNWTRKIHIGTRRVTRKKTVKIGRIFDRSNAQLAKVEASTFAGVKRLLRQTKLVPASVVIKKKDTFYTI